MLFPTPTFALLLTAVLAVSWLLRGHPQGWRVLLVVAGGVFYGYASPRLVLLLAGTTLANWALARAISASERWGHAVLVAGVAADLGLLGAYKYYDFFVTSVSEALSSAGVTFHPPLLQVVLPVGISFLTFEAISYLVEVRHGTTPAASLLDVAVWLSFFPTVTAGPITRPSELLPQLPRRGEPHVVEWREGTWLCTRGLVKKAVLATWLSTHVAESAFAAPSSHTALELLLGVYAYAAVIYLDFSGYTDLARGSALLLGVRLPENFAAPYAARSVHDFWNRWHMSLSRWLRDYLFTPLAKRSRARWWRSFAVPVVVMLLAGLWHGAAWTFVAFGAVHGVALAVERWMTERRRAAHRARRDTTASRVLAHVVAFHVVCLGWVFFASDSLSTAWVVLQRLVTQWHGSPELTATAVALVVAVVLVQQLPARLTATAKAAYLRLGVVPAAAGLALGLLLVDALGPTGVPPFIYYRF